MRHKNILMIFSIVFFAILTSSSVLATSLSHSNNDIEDKKVSSLLSDQLFEKEFRKENKEISITSEKSETSKQEAYIWFDEKPTEDELQKLRDLKVSIDKNKWVPPVGSHPYGFIPATLSSDTSLLKNIANLNFIIKITSAEKITKTTLDRSVPATRADIIRDIGVYGDKYNGSGVRLAVIDTGYDYLNNQYLKQPVDMDDMVDPPLDVFPGEDISDEEGHGSHVAGTIVSNNSTYKGIAPGVDLVFLDVATHEDIDKDVTDAIRRAVDDYQANVISVSIGTWTGLASHRNGVDAMSQAVDYAKSQGATVVVSAGNDADEGRHIHGTVPADSHLDYQIEVSSGGSPNFYLIWDNEDINLDFELYKDSDQDGTFEDSEIECPNPLGGTETYWSYNNNLNLDYKGFLDDNVDFVSTFDTTEDWMIRVINNGNSEQSFDLYQENSDIGVTFASPTPDRTITAPAVAEGALTVGSYVTKNGWSDFRGNSWGYNNVNNGQLSPFSSMGPTLDGRVKPDIVAPGQGIVSASSRDASYDDRRVVNEGTHFIDSNGVTARGDVTELTNGWVVKEGTSMAAPHVSGSAALLIEQYEDKYGNEPTPDEIQLILTSNADTSGLPQNFNQNEWGAGKLDVYKASRSLFIEKGLSWLRGSQNSDGSWSNDVGITSLAALTFLNAGYDETDPAVRDAIEYILEYVNGDGSIHDGWYKTYQTSLATLALVATHNDSYSTEIENAAQWLKDSQWDEDCLWGSVSKDSWYYGGFGYGSHIRPDLSNSQFALMALDAATTISKDDLVWDKAQVFLARTQMHQQNVMIPDLGYEVEWNSNYNRYDDGGFVYYPGVSLSGTGTSYGSMTAAGIWSLRLCNVPTDAPRVQAALDWHKNHYTLEENPGMTPDARRFQYYYYLAFSKAMMMTAGEGTLDGHDWYGDLSNKLIDLQHTDGHWINTYTGHGGEGNDDLCTAYSVLSLQVREIPTNIQRLSWLTFVLHSNADLHVYDPVGRHVGKNYQTGEIENQIPGATVESNGEQKITVPELETGNYRVVLIGTGDGSYELTVSGGVGDQTIKEETFANTITEGETHETNVAVAMITGLTIKVEEPKPAEPQNLPPVADANGPYIADEGSTIALDASGSSDPDGDELKYRWDFNNDSIWDTDWSTSPTTTYTWGDDWSDESKVEVSDGELNDTDTAAVTVNNVAPTLSLDTSWSTMFASGKAFTGRKGVEQTHEAEATDQGSDDLTFNWSFGVESVYYNDGTGPDLYPSPDGNYPFSATDNASVTFTAPGVYTIGVEVEDDDGGVNATSLSKLVTDNYECTKSQGFWKHQFGKGRHQVDDITLQAYLDIVNFASLVFSENLSADTIENASKVMWFENEEDQSVLRDNAEAQLLAAWLNYAYGAVGWEEEVPLDDGSSMSFNELMEEAENIVINESATHKDLEHAKNLTEAVNLLDEDNPVCEEDEEDASEEELEEEIDNNKSKSRGK